MCCAAQQHWRQQAIWMHSPMDNTTEVETQNVLEIWHVLENNQLHLHTDLERLEHWSDFASTGFIQMTQIKGHLKTTRTGHKLTVWMRPNTELSSMILFTFCNLPPNVKLSKCPTVCSKIHIIIIIINDIPNSSHLVICEFFPHFAGTFLQYSKKILCDFYTVSSTQYTHMFTRCTASM